MQAATKRLPALFEQLRAAFQRRGSLRMPYNDAVTAVLGMHLSDAGMSRTDAAVHLDLLARAAPDWLAIDEASTGGGSGGSRGGVKGRSGEEGRMLVMGKMCTGVRQRLEDVAHGYAHV